MTIISGLPDDTVQAERDRNTQDNDYVAYMCAAYYVNGQGVPHYPLPVIILDVTPRPMGLAIWRCYDGKEGDRFTIERKWFNPRFKVN